MPKPRLSSRFAALLALPLLGGLAPKAQADEGIRLIAATALSSDYLDGDFANPNAETSDGAPPSPITPETIQIDGDKLDLAMDRKMRASGNAVLHRGDKAIYGDTIEYDVQNDELHVEGNARIDSTEMKLAGPELRMRLGESTGEMKNATITLYQKPNSQGLPAGTVSSEVFSKRLGNLQSEHLGDYRQTTQTAEDDTADLDHILATINGTNSGTNNSTNNNDPTPKPSKPVGARGFAEAILFEGQDKKHLKNAQYTTCNPGHDDWFIKAKDLVLDDYTERGTAKHGYVEFKGIPILYSPWMSFSYNNQRISGLLAPTWGTTSRSGFEFLMPYYWNISPNMDATLGTRVLSKRGVQLQGEYRYLSENFSGIDNVEYLPSDNITQQNRYYANLKHQHNFGGGWSGGYSFEKVSDDEYFADMTTRVTTTSRVNLPQQMHLNYGNDVWSFNALAQKYQTLDKASYPYERLPQLTLTGAKNHNGFDTNLTSQLVMFDSSNPLNTLPTGTRFTLNPSISYPMQQSFGYLTPKLSLHHSYYNLNNNGADNTIQRSLPIFSVDGGVYFDKDYHLASGNYLHAVEPRLFYVYIPSKNQDNIPVFDSSIYDLNFSSMFLENQFSGQDRINDANQLSLAFTNRLINSDTGVELISASIGQRHYFNDQKVTLPGMALRTSNNSDIIASVSTNLVKDWTLGAFWQYNTSGNQLLRNSVSSRYAPEPGKILNLSYSYLKDSVNQINASGQWPLGNGWYGVGRINYTFKEKQFIETMAGLEYNAGCWIGRAVMHRVTTATTEPNYALFFQLELGGIASIGSDPLEVVKRNVPGYVNTNLVPGAQQPLYYE